MTDESVYTPPKVWHWDQEDSGASINSFNRPVAGATHEKALPVGKHPFQLYSMATPNGVKVTVMLEELLALGHTGAQYDAHLIKLSEGDQFGSGFGHFYSYAPVKIKYSIDRFSLEVKRQLDVLDRHLADKHYICGDEYTIADIAIWPWYGALVLNKVYEAAEFLNTASYKHLNRWALEISNRDAVKRGCMVNRVWGPDEGQLHERHDSSDFDTKS